MPRAESPCHGAHICRGRYCWCAAAALPIDVKHARYYSSNQLYSHRVRRRTTRWTTSSCCTGRRRKYACGAPGKRILLTRSARYHVFAGVTALWLASCVAGIVLIEVGRTCPVQQLRWWWSVLIISVPDTFLAAFECCRVACCFAQAPGRSLERAASRRCALWLRSDVANGAQTLRCRLQVFLVLSAGPP